MKKILRIGNPIGHEYSIYIKVEYTEDGRLSITGVEGPQRNGNAFGGCGQILMSYEGYGKHPSSKIEEISPAPGWTHAKIHKLFAIWDKWHLNDMRPNCAHQVGPDWEYKDVEVTKYSLDWQAKRELERIADMDVESALGYRIVLDNRHGLVAASQHSTAAAVLLGILDLGIECFKGKPISPETWQQVTEGNPEFTRWRNEHESAFKMETETKGNGWLHPEEHPAGLLCKPCPECGYKYGTAWQREEVPADVIEWLAALPDTDRKPAWI